MNRQQLPKAYLRIDPNIDQHPDPGGMLMLICAANRQQERGVFRDVGPIIRALGTKKRAHQFLQPRPGRSKADVLTMDDGTFYLDGWREWQEGDCTVGERVARLRQRRNSGVTVPVSQPLQNRSSPSEAGGVRRKALSPSPPSAHAGAPPREDQGPNGRDAEIQAEIQASLDGLVRAGWDAGEIPPALRKASYLPPKGSRPERFATSVSELTGRWGEITASKLRQMLAEAQVVAARVAGEGPAPDGPEQDPEAAEAWDLALRRVLAAGASPAIVSGQLRTLIPISLATDADEGSRQITLRATSAEHAARVQGGGLWERVLQAAQLEGLHRVRVEAPSTGGAAA